MTSIGCQVSLDDLQREVRRDEIHIHNVARLYGSLNLGKLRLSPDRQPKQVETPLGGEPMHVKHSLGGGGDAYMKEVRTERQYEFFDNREPLSVKRLT